MAEYFAELTRLISLTSNEQVKNFLQAEADKHKPAPIVKKPMRLVFSSCFFCRHFFGLLSEYIIIILIGVSFNLTIFFCENNG